MTGEPVLSDEETRATQALLSGAWGADTNVGILLWCFAQLPAEASENAMSAYVAAMSEAGVRLGSTWNMALGAALGTLAAARGESLAEAIGEDDKCGTTTMRPRLLSWLRAFAGFPASAEVAPRLRELAASLLERLEPRWPSARVPAYPALAAPGDVVATIPGSWDEI